MKDKIVKLRKLDWKLKMLICVIATVMGFACEQILFSNVESKIKKYDYKKIYSVNGVVTKAYFKKNYISFWPSFDNNSSAYIDVKLETGKIITIELGKKLSYSKGDDISMYTNGSNYSFTKRGVAIDSQNTITNLLLVSFIWIFIITVWGILFEWKGLIISFLMLIFYSLK